MQKKTPISGTDTLGTVYFDRLFPMGVEAMLESVDLVKAGKAPRIKQDEVEGDLRRPLRPRQRQDRLGQAVGADRPADPRLQSGARRLDARSTARQLKIFDAKPLPAKDPKGIAGKIGEIVAVEADGFTVVCADGRFKVTRVQPADGKKIDAGEWAKSANLAVKAQIHVTLIVIPAQARTRSSPAVVMIGCPPRGHDERIIATCTHSKLDHPMPASQHQSPEVRHRNLAGRQEAAASSTSPRKSSASRRRTSIPTATTRPRSRSTTSSRSRTRRTAS